mmetsp:Transcript_52219/g.155832  ORF Transcript_52219/g.155832 Transcript_52219/m.155832 type:complete len:642 (-) Transcript_52219:175-2100(-)
MGRGRGKNIAISMGSECTSPHMPPRAQRRPAAGASPHGSAPPQPLRGRLQRPGGSCWCRGGRRTSAEGLALPLRDPLSSCSGLLGGGAHQGLARRLPGRGSTCVRSLLRHGNVIHDLCSLLRLHVLRDLLNAVLPLRFRLLDASGWVVVSSRPIPHRLPRGAVPVVVAAVLLRPDLLPARWQGKLGLQVVFDHVVLLLGLLLLLSGLLPRPALRAGAAAAAEAACGAGRGALLRHASHAAPKPSGGTVEACGGGVQRPNLEGAQAVHVVPVQQEVHLRPRGDLVARLHVGRADVDLVLVLLKQGPQLLAEVLDGHGPAEGALPLGYAALHATLAEQLRGRGGAGLLRLLGGLLHWPFPRRGLCRPVPIVHRAVRLVVVLLPAFREGRGRLQRGLAGSILLPPLLAHLILGLLLPGGLLLRPAALGGRVLLRAGRGLRRPLPRRDLRGPVPVVKHAVLLAPNGLPALRQGLLEIILLRRVPTVTCSLVHFLLLPPFSFEILRICGRLLLVVVRKTMLPGPLPSPSSLPSGPLGTCVVRSKWWRRTRVLRVAVRADCPVLRAEALRVAVQAEFHKGAHCECLDLFVADGVVLVHEDLPAVLIRLGVVYLAGRDDPAPLLPPGVYMASEDLVRDRLTVLRPRPR